MRLMVYDTESTGCKDSQICQIAWLIVDGAHVTGAQRYFTVDDMNPAAERVHGLSMSALEQLSGGARFADSARALRDVFDSCDLIVGHNVAADQKAVATEFDRLGLQMPKKDTLCTMNAFTRVVGLTHPGGGKRLKPPKLSELSAYYGLTEEIIARTAAVWFGGGAQAHDARYDAAATWMCLREGLMRGDVSLRTTHHTTAKRVVNSRPRRRSAGKESKP